MITIDCRMWYSSGIGTYLRNLVPRVTRRMPDVDFVLLGDAEHLAGVQGGNVSVRPLAAPIYSIREQWELLAAIPDRTVLYWSPHYNIPVFSAKPLLVTIHDAVHVAMPELFPGLRRQVYAALMFRAALLKAKKVLTDSQFTVSELQRLFGRFAPEAGMQVIQLGVGAEWFSIPASPSPYQKPFILFVGNVKPHKNLRGLVAAFDSIKGDLDADLVIVGEREGFLTFDHELMKDATRLGDRVHFTGRVSFEVLQQYYTHAKMLVLPSFYEGFGLTALEAMAAGCPVAVSRAASLPEVCGDAAMYFNPADIAERSGVILQTIRDESLREDLRARGFRQAKEFTWDRTADRTVKVIRDILQ